MILSDTKRTFRFGRFAFVFWDRSFALIGLIVGFLLKMILFSQINVVFEYDTIFFLTIIYAVLTLTVASLLGVVNARSVLMQRSAEQDLAKRQSVEHLSTDTSLSEKCKSLAEKYGLSSRETEVFELLAQGRSLPYVQKMLHIAPGTATTHINHIYQKLGVSSKQEMLDLVYAKDKSA